MMMSLKDFLRKYSLKNKATCNTKIQGVLKKKALNPRVKTNLRDGNFSTNCDILNLHPSEGVHWVGYIKNCYFDIFFEHQIEQKDGLCASYVLYIFCLTKVLGTDSRSAVVNLYHQKIQKR